VAIIGSGFTGLTCAIFSPRNTASRPPCWKRTGSAGAAARATAARRNARRAA
jgi:thioredoxin reductase